MKRLLIITLLFIGIAATAQDFKSRWEKVTSLESQGRLKDAAAETDAIYKLAKKKRNEPQLIRAFFFKSKYMQKLEPNAQALILKNLQTEIKTATPATAAFMQSLYAQMLYTLYDQNRYKLRNRTKVDVPAPENIGEWTEQNYKDAIYTAFESSIANRDLLYKTPLSAYADVVDFVPLLVKTNRSLYDFLLEPYLNYLHVLDRYNNGYYPSAQQMLLLLGDEHAFKNLVVADTASSIEKMFRLSQDAEAFYMQKKDTYALQNTVLRRLGFAQSHIGGVTQNKEVLLSTYTQLATRWGDSPFAYRAMLFRAQMLESLASKDKHPDYMQTAIEICTTIIAAKEKNDVSLQAENLKADIESSELNIMSERYVMPGQPALAQIRFKNLTTVRVAFYKVPYPSYNSRKSYNYGNSSKYVSEDDSIVKNSTPVVVKEYTLPQVAPHFEYSTEIALPPIQNGYYLLAVCPAVPNPDAKEYAFTHIQATGITVLSQNADSITNYYVTHRNTGEPVKDAVIAYEGTTLKTGENGKAILRGPDNKNGNFPVMVTYRGDTLSSSFYRYVPSNSYDEDEEPQVKVNVYFDRAIYRPGQKVFFKGIVTQTKKDVSGVVPNVFFSVNVHDDSDNEIYRARLKTNEFGSFTGEIQLPKNGPTGSYQLEVDEDEDMEKDPAYDHKEDEHPFWDYVDFESDYYDFRVEEYKRPTFEVTFNPVTKAYGLNDSITITGKAKSFSGAALAGAKVKYRVRRTKEYRYYNYHNYDYGADDDRFYGSKGESGRLLHEGEMTTDAQGNITLTFKAETNAADRGEKDLNYSYTVYADVTDVNGETHSASSTVKAGTTLLYPTVGAPNTIEAEKGAQVNFSVNNSNNQPQKVKGTVYVYKKTAPANIHAERPWNDPEIPMDKAEFERLFPHIPYHKTNHDTLVNPKPYLVKEVNTATGNEFTLKDFKNWPSGAYRVVFVVKDSLGHEEKADTAFMLTRKKDTYLPDNRLFTFRLVNANPAKDGYAEVEIRTALPVLYGNIQATVNKGIHSEKAITVKGGKAVIKIPGVKDPKTNMNIGFDFVWQNSLHQDNVYASFLTPKVPIAIETESLVSKLAPGSEQMWSFTLKNAAANEAELLASMYDASLDEFNTQEWDGLSSQYYPYNDRLYKELTTHGTNYGNFNNRKVFNNSNQKYSETFYMYGFDILPQNNQYAAITPKAQVPGPDDVLVSGTVTTIDGEPLPGTTVRVKGENESIVTTDGDGKYSIYAADGETLVFTYVTVEKTQKFTKGTTTIDMVFEEQLDEVVVMGYMSYSKETRVGAVTISSTTIQSSPNASFIQSLQGQVPGLNISTGSGAPGSKDKVVIRGVASTGAVAPLYVIDGVPMSADGFQELNADEISDISILKDAAATAIYGSRGANGVVVITTKKTLEELKTVKTRKNFNETAFFYPQLKTDKKGNISFTFTTPEALTEWKLRLFAHDKKAVHGYLEKNFYTQKDLMVTPNMPRFLRETDTITIQAKITNLTPGAKEGAAMLQLLDAVTLEPVDAAMGNANSTRPFSIPANGNTTVNWKISVPAGLQGVQYKVVAKAGTFTDGEENILPVLPNSMLVTESIPLWVRENTTETYTLENFKNNTSTTLRHQGITLEYTSNPAWLALRSLPYLMEYEHDCSEQLFSRVYANSIAAHIMNSSPKIAEVFKTWRDKGITPRLEQNEELKSILLAETPWVLDAQSQDEQNNRLATLFDLDKIRTGLTANLKRLEERQSASGGFAWFPGYDDSEYITRHIAAGFGHLQKLGITPADSTRIFGITQKAIPFIDGRFMAWHRQQEKNRKKSAFTIINPYSSLHYLYTRSFYLEQYAVGDSLAKAIKPYITYTKAHWAEFSLYEKGLAALVLHRFGEKATAQKILTYLKQSGANNEDLGMYWLENTPGWWWYRAPIETQALLIEAFAEINNDTKSVDAMRVWLIKQKQNKHWPTTKATTEAVYALLMKGTDWLSVQGSTKFTLGDKKALDKKMAEADKEAGTGYIKLQWTPEEVTKDMATLTVKNTGTVPGYGGFYWQYFEDLDKIKTAQDGIINVKKDLYRKNPAVQNITLEPITPNTPLKVGDLVTVRLVLTLTEDMEYVHLKDMRAAAFEPVDVLSGHHYKDGLGYYQSTRDAATNFFFDGIKTGTYVLEYDLRVNNAGEFSNGITTIQSMYAPEFSGHTQGIRVRAE